MIKKERVKGAFNNLIDKKLSALDASERRERAGIESVAYDVADAAIILYREKIAAGLRRAGLEFSNEDTITLDKIFDAIKLKTGVDLRSFDADELKQKALSGLSTAMTESVGVEIDLSNGVESALNGAVEAVIKSGGGRVLDAAKKAGVRRLALAAKANITVESLKKAQNAKRQANFRRNAAAAVWVLR